MSLGFRLCEKFNSSAQMGRLWRDAAATLWESSPNEARPHFSLIFLIHHYLLASSLWSAHLSAHVPRTPHQLSLSGKSLNFLPLVFFFLNWWPLSFSDLFFISPLSCLPARSALTPGMVFRLSVSCPTIDSLAFATICCSPDFVRPLGCPLFLWVVGCFCPSHILTITALCSIHSIHPLVSTIHSNFPLKLISFLLKRNILRCYADLKPNVPTRNCIRSLRSQDLCKWYHTNCRLVMRSSKSY